MDEGRDRPPLGRKSWRISHSNVLHPNWQSKPDLENDKSTHATYHEKDALFFFVRYGHHVLQAGEG